MKYRIDFHVHSGKSKDALGSLKEISYFARRRGINAVAIADHDIFSLEEIVEVNGVHFIPAIELRTFVGHIVCLLPKKFFDPRSAYHTPIEIIHKVEGYAVWAHPFDRVLFKKIKTIIPDAIEVYNSASFPFKSSSSKAFLLAKELSVPMVAGSDAHLPEDVGLCYVEVEASSINDAIEKVFLGKGLLYGSSRPPSHMIKLVFGRIIKRLV